VSYKQVDLDRGENPDHEGYYRKLGLLKPKPKEEKDFCRACIDCKDSWSAGMDLSCHDACDKFQEWKERKDDVSRLQKRND